MRQRTGTIDLTREGKHRLRMTLPIQGRVTVGIFDTRSEAELERRASLRGLADVDDDQWTVRTWGDRWLTARDVGKTVRDPESDWSRWRTHIESDPIARMSLTSVRRRHCRDWLKRVRAKVARQTAVNCLNVMRGLFGAALEDELVKANPATGLKLPREKRTEETWKFATPAEQQRLLLAAGPLERPIIAFSIGTGLRAGELVSLRLADVHVDGPDPRVVVRYGTPPNLSTKGGKPREVPLFGIGLQAAREWLALLPSFAKKNPHGLMFPRQRGGFRDELHVFPWATWSRIRTAAGLVDFRWHDLRHTAASSLVSGWWGRMWTLIEVRDFLGHESITTTERYGKLADTALKRAASETRGGGSIGLNWPQRPAARHENPESSRAVPPAGIGPTTLGLGSPWESLGILHDPAREGQMMAVCLDYLMATARGNSDEAERLRCELGAVAFGTHARATNFAADYLEERRQRAEAVAS